MPDPVRGWEGGGGSRYPHPCQVNSCHVATHLTAYVCQLSFNKILTKQTKHTCSFKCSASQTATWHVNFRVHHTYRSILNLNNCRREALMAAVEERKEPPARRMPLTLDCLVWSKRFILKLLHTVQYRNAKTV
jgi:hypothetical protein